ncbi:MAG: hypothetical protein M3O31_12855 [Acidobacteriota bacterium]|nr:hypothetical protein [Acidobacteriota bacterium]
MIEVVRRMGCLPSRGNVNLSRLSSERRFCSIEINVPAIANIPTVVRKIPVSINVAPVLCSWISAKTTFHGDILAFLQLSPKSFHVLRCSFRLMRILGLQFESNKTVLPE